MDALAWAKERRDEILAELVAFASIPSVSTDPAYAAHIRGGLRNLDGGISGFSA